MKRLTILLVLLVMTVAVVGCRRGAGTWGLRGARCAPMQTVPAMPTAVTTSAPVAVPMTTTSPPCGMSDPTAVYSPETTVLPEVYPVPTTELVEPIPAG